MITFTEGDILSAQTQAIVNTVNCVGVMGRGIALQFKTQYPENYKAYAAKCKAQLVVPGEMFVYPTGETVAPEYIINFPTKRHWRDKSRIEDIESGLVDLVTVIQQYAITSIAVPPLGCGLGGLDWRDVKPLINNFLGSLDGVDVVVYEPRRAVQEAPKFKLNKTPPPMTIGRATLIHAIALYKNAFLDPEITLLEIQKLMYFAQEAGESLRLDYVEGPYGPYAKNLRHVLLRIEGHFTIHPGMDTMAIIPHI